MTAVNYPFESDLLRQARRLRQSMPSGVGTFAGLGDRPTPLRGDGHAPYVHTIARASSDGQAGSVVVTDGEPQRILSDLYGRLWTRAVPGGGGTVDTYHSASAVEQVQVFTGAGRLFQLRAILDDAVVEDRFAQVFDTAAVVAAGSPLWEGLIPGSATTDTQYAQMADDFEPIGGLVLTTGLRLVVSTTPGVYTSPAADEVWFMASYET